MKLGYLKEVRLVKSLFSKAIVFRKTRFTNKGTIMSSGRLILGKVYRGEKPFLSSVLIKKGGKLICKNNFSIYSGCRVTIEEGAVLILGSGYVNYDAKINCFNKISIGEKVMIGENVVIRDSDNHEIERNSKPSTAPIVIEDDVWIGANCTILKGVRIGRGSVIAAGSVVIDDVLEHSLVAGVPATTKKEKIKWR